jgi:regulator of protease activity HflC (stomatin/prohibitin superfamily)
MTKVTHKIFGLRVVIPEMERAVILKDGIFEVILNPGRHTIGTLGTQSRYDVWNFRVNAEPVISELLTSILRNHGPAVADHLTVFETAADEMAIVSLDGTPAFLVPPLTRKVVWTDAGLWSTEVANLSDGFVMTDAMSRRLMTLRSDFIKRFKVEHGQIGLLHVDGKMVGELVPGGHAVWSYGKVIAVKLVDTRENALDVTGQEILTKDRVSIRANLSATYRVVDPVLAVTAVKDFVDTLHRALGSAFRRSLATKTLDEVLAEKGAVDAEAMAAVVTELAAAGVKVTHVTLKDIILPGDMREILNTVVLAEKEAEAGVIRRREEAAETRALLNTAKVMADNPAMMRLKELEALESISAKVGTLTVHSGTKGLMEDLVSLSVK